jgi:hypothetical protein
VCDSSMQLLSTCIPVNALNALITSSVGAGPSAPRAGLSSAATAGSAPAADPTGHTTGPNITIAPRTSASDGIGGETITTAGAGHSAERPGMGPYVCAGATMCMCTVLGVMLLCKALLTRWSCSIPSNAIHPSIHRVCTRCIHQVQYSPFVVMAH